MWVVFIFYFMFVCISVFLSYICNFLKNYSWKYLSPKTPKWYSYDTLKISPCTVPPLLREKGRACCSLWALWGFTVWAEAPKSWLSSSMASLVSRCRGGWQRPRKTQFAWLGTMSRGRDSLSRQKQDQGFQPAPQSELVWGIFCCLLVLRFVDCFVLLGLLLVFSRFHMWQPGPPPNQTTCAVPGQPECWIWAWVWQRTVWAWHPGIHRKQASLGLAIFCFKSEALKRGRRRQRRKKGQEAFDSWPGNLSWM